MKLMPWRHRQPMHVFPDMDWFRSFFDDGWNGGAEGRAPVLPALNLSETEKEFSAAMELPGMDEDDVEVQILGNQLVVSGERKWKDEKQEKDYYRVESRFGSFKRAVELPDGLNTDPDAVHAAFRKGMLEITIPKVEPKPAARIKVRS